MNHQDVALLAAGSIGCVVAVIHGFLTQRILIDPIGALPETTYAARNKRLTAALLQFTTVNWVLSGAMLIFATLRLERETLTMVALLAASSFAYGAAANFWSVRRFHPGWFLYGLAVAAIVYGLLPQHV